MVWDSSEAVKLVIQANNLYHEGDTSEALRLIDEAINLAESANSTEHALQWRIHRAVLFMGNADDLSELIAVSQEALDFYTQKRNVLGQLEALMNLTGLMAKLNDKPRALRYLDDAETLLSSLIPSDLSLISSALAGSAVSTEILLELKSAEIKRLRKYLME